LTEEHSLGTTVLSSGGRTAVPKQVMELLSLRYAPQSRQKLLWIEEDGEVVVKKGTLQSSFRKSILSRGGKTAIPKHMREALKLKSTPGGLERVTWIQKGKDVIVRKERPGRAGRNEAD
jgi:hypothetical protein